MNTYLNSLQHLAIRPGDYVKVVGTLLGHEAGWGADWASQMEDYVGETGKVVSFDRSSGVRIDFADGERNFWFPPQVLVKVAAPTVQVRLNGEYIAEVTPTGVKVGCQTFSHDAITRLNRAVEAINHR